MAGSTRTADMQREIESLKELQEQQARTMEEMRQMLVALNASNETHRSHRNQSGNEGESSHQRRNYLPQFNRMQRLEFPRFCGEDVKGWLFRCDQFFDVDETPEDSKVKIASLHLDGKALQWHRIYLKNRLTRELPRWKDHVFALHNRFGVGFNFDCFDNSVDELMTLEQSGSVQNYIHDFNKLLKLVDVNEYVAISCFIRGLSDDIEVQVRMCEPKTLQKAFSLAKSYDQLLHLATRKQSCIQIPPLLSYFSNPKETFVDRVHIVHPTNDFQLQVGELVDEVYNSNKCSRLIVDVKDVEEGELCKVVEGNVVQEKEIEQKNHPRLSNDTEAGVYDYKHVQAAWSVTLTDDQHIRQGTNGKDFPKQEEWQGMLANINELCVELNLCVDGGTNDICMVLRERHHTYEYHVFKALPIQELEKHQLIFHVSQLKKKKGLVTQFHVDGNC